MSRSFAAVRELNPSPEQVQDLLRHVGSVRFAQNWALDFIKSKMEAKESQSWSYFSLSNAWREHREEVAPWYSEVSKETFQYGCERLAKGLSNWKKNKKHFKFPKKRKRGRNDSVGYSAGKLKSPLEVHLPRIGKVSLKEAFELPEGCRITGMIVKKIANRWFVSFRMKEDKWVEPEKVEINTVVGVDAGIGDTFAALSSGIKIDNPRHYRKAERKLRKLNKAFSRKQKESNNRRKAGVSLSKAYFKIACKRKDFLHKFTAKLVKTHDEIVIEDLNLAAMKLRKGFKLGKSVSDVGWGEARRQLTYKASWYGKTLTVVDRFFPSSKMCFECKAVNKDLELKQRSWVCPACGADLDRDLNAAKNLEAASSVASAWSERMSEMSVSESRTGDDVRQELVPAVVCEAGTFDAPLEDGSKG